MIWVPMKGGETAPHVVGDREKFQKLVQQNSDRVDNPFQWQNTMKIDFVKKIFIMFSFELKS